MHNHLYNLVPVCKVCNQLKSAQKGKIVSPYNLEKGIGSPFIEETKEISEDKTIEDKVKEIKPVRKRPDNSTYIKEIEKSVQKLVTIGDSDTLEYFKQVLEWLNDYACNKKLMEQLAPFEVDAYYDNCLRYKDNITEALEYNISHFQTYFDDDFK